MKCSLRELGNPQHNLRWHSTSVPLLVLLYYLLTAPNLALSHLADHSVFYQNTISLGICRVGWGLSGTLANHEVIHVAKDAFVQPTHLVYQTMNGATSKQPAEPNPCSQAQPRPARPAWPGPAQAARPSPSETSPAWTGPAQPNPA